MAAEEFDLKSCHVVLAPQAISSSNSPAYPIRRQIDEHLWGEILPQFREKAKKDTFERLVTPLINPVRRELGLADWTIANLPSMEKSDAILALFPEWLKPNPGDWPTQLVTTGFILGDTKDSVHEQELSDFIRNHGSPLVFTFGTGIPVNTMLIDKVKRVCSAVGKPGVFVYHSQAANLFENGSQPVLTLPSASFSALFPKSALVVHHGGIGTCAQALAGGIPQAISPYTFDQPDNAFLLWRLGVGNALDFFNDSVDDIASVLADLLAAEDVKLKAINYQDLTSDQTEEAANFLLNL